MATAQELYTNILPHAMAAYAAKSSDMESAKQMAHALASECVNECARMGLLEDVSMAPAIGGGNGRLPAPAPMVMSSQVAQPGSGAQGLARFAETETQGGSPGGIMPIGAPHQPAQHYNVTGGPGAPQPPAPIAAPAAPWYPPHLAHLHRPAPMAPAAVCVGTSGFCRYRRTEPSALGQSTP